MFTVKIHYVDNINTDIINNFATKELAAIYIKEEIVNWLVDCPRHHLPNIYDLTGLREHWNGDINLLIQSWNHQSMMEFHLTETKVVESLVNKYPKFPFDEDMEDE